MSPEIIITILIALVFPFLYRMHGGGFVSLPWKLDEVVISVAVTATLAPFMTQDWFIPLMFLWTIGLKLKGHGQWMTLVFAEHSVKRIKAEDIDIIPRLFFGKDPRTTVSKYTNKKGIVSAIKKYGEKKLRNRCLVGLFVSGLSVFLVPSILLIVSGHVLLGIAFVLATGVFKSLGYYIGWKIFPNGTSPEAPYEELNEATEIGEFVAGIGVSLGLLLTLFFL